MREYAVYDTKDNERLVMIGNANEISNYFKIKKHIFYQVITRKNKIKRRYEVVKIEKNEID